MIARNQRPRFGGASPGMDDVAAGVGLLLVALAAAPMALFITLAIVAEDDCPVIMVERRVGRNGVLFPCFTFRTQRSGGRAPTATWVGRILRASGLEDLPQLYNVLRGEMALFGPRPLPQAEFSQLGWSHNTPYALKPGLFDPKILCDLNQCFMRLL